MAAASESRLNAFMAKGETFWSALRLALSRTLREAGAAPVQLGLSNFDYAYWTVALWNHCGTGKKKR